MIRIYDQIQILYPEGSVQIINGKYRTRVVQGLTDLVRSQGKTINGDKYLPLYQLPPEAYKAIEDVSDLELPSYPWWIRLLPEPLYLRNREYVRVKELSGEVKNGHDMSW